MLGVDVESPPAVAAAAAASVAIAVGLWLLNRRWLALLAVGFGAVFVVFDIAEISHQLDESRTVLISGLWGLEDTWTRMRQLAGDNLELSSLSNTRPGG